MSEEVSALPRSRTTLRQAWSERLERFATAQLSVVAFCRAEGVSPHTFYYWKRQLASPTPALPDEAPRLLPVRLLADPAPIEVLLNTGTILRLTPGCDLAFVRSLAEALGRLPC
jgi:transposase-like protein